MFPVSDDLPRAGAVGDRARLPGLTGGHVVQHVLHRAAVRQRTLSKVSSLTLKISIFGNSYKF